VAEEEVTRVVKLCERQFTQTNSVSPTMGLVSSSGSFNRCSNNSHSARHVINMAIEQKIDGMANFNAQSVIEYALMHS
jgi:hypothetical protein